MANTIQRTVDVVARYGGEEFAVILPNAPLAGATVVAERIRCAIERLDLSDGNHAGRNMTVSIGVATVTPHRTGGFSGLIAAADAALYQAKREGRNRVVAIDLDAASQPSR